MAGTTSTSTQVLHGAWWSSLPGSLPFGLSCFQPSSSRLLINSHFLFQYVFVDGRDPSRIFCDLYLTFSILRWHLGTANYLQHFVATSDKSQPGRYILYIEWIYLHKEMYQLAVYLWSISYQYIDVGMCDPCTHCFWKHSARIATILVMLWTKGKHIHNQWSLSDKCVHYISTDVLNLNDYDWQQTNTVENLLYKTATILILT